MLNLLDFVMNPSFGTWGQEWINESGNLAVIFLTLLKVLIMLFGPMMIILGILFSGYLVCKLIKKIWVLVY